MTRRKNVPQFYVGFFGSRKGVFHKFHTYSIHVKTGRVVFASRSSVICLGYNCSCAKKSAMSRSSARSFFLSADTSALRENG